MAFSESFDPRTWTRGWAPSGRKHATPGARQPRASRLGFALAAAILVGGAVVAYATRGETAVEAAG